MTQTRAPAPPAPRKRTRRATQRLTMNDVAAAAGVSPSTVSLFFRRPEAVSPHLAERVRQVIDEMGYVPNLVAGSLAAAQSRTVAVILPSIINSFYAETYNTLQSLFQGAQYQTLLGVSEFSTDQEEELIRAFLAWSPAAVVVTGLQHTERGRAMLRGARVPVVEMWDMPSTPDEAVDLSVGFSHIEVGRRQAEHLYDQGARKIAYIGAAAHQDMRVRSRTSGYEDEVRRRGLHEPISLIAPEQASTPVGVRLIGEVLDAHPDVDGVVCSNDTLALGVLFEARSRGVSVPGDLAVIGFGDLAFARACVPALSTVRPPQREIGRLVATQVLARLGGATLPSSHHALECELVVRDSTRGAEEAA